MPAPKYQSDLSLTKSLAAECCVPLRYAPCLLFKQVITTANRYRDKVVATSDGINHHLVFRRYNTAKYSVLAVKPGCFNMGDKKLTAIGAGTRIGHRQFAGGIMPERLRAEVSRGLQRAHDGLVVTVCCACCDDGLVVLVVCGGDGLVLLVVCRGDGLVALVVCRGVCM